MYSSAWGLAAGAAVIAALLAGCSSHPAGPRATTTSTAGPGPATTPSDPTSSPTAAPSLKDQVIAAHKAYEAAYAVCATNPATCDVSSVVIAGSPAAGGVASFMAQLAKDGLRGRPSPQTYYVYEAFTPADTGTQTVLRVCTVDANVTYKPNSGPQGQDVIVNDRLDSDLGDWTFRLDGTAWKLYVTNVVSQWKGTNGCPPRPSA